MSSRSLPSSKYLMLALDHRDGFRKIINPNNPDLVTKEEAIEYKKLILETLKDKFSTCLIDEDYGLPAYKSIPSLANKPYILPLENSGYIEEDGERITVVETSASHLKSLGASAAKIVLYYCPGSKSASRQIETARKAVEDSHNEGLPIFLEIVTYNSDLGDRVFTSVKDFLKEKVVPDVFKLEYPGSEEECIKVTNILGDIPWILLTRGINYSLFCDQLEIAAKKGCQGFLAGRSLWQELLTIKDENERNLFLKETLPNRFDEIKEIVNSYTAQNEISI